MIFLALCAAIGLLALGIFIGLMCRIGGASGIETPIRYYKRTDIVT